MIRVVLADDQVLFRDMLKFILNYDTGIEVVGCAGDGREVMDICGKVLPDIVLMDIKMPQASGIDALSAIKGKHPDVKVIMLTTFDDEEQIASAYRNGADGYILKDIEPEVLIMTIKCVSKDLFVIHKNVHSYIFREFNLATSNRVTINLEGNTAVDFDRVERAIIKYISEGKSNKEIAERMNFSEGTIKNRISKILEATGLNDRTQIVVFALKNNLI